MTREQYAGAYRPKISMLNHAKDALNPLVNTRILKERIAVIDFYKFRYGADHTYWVHAAMRRMSGNLNRYKFNYALKAFLAYQVYSAE